MVKIPDGWDYMNWNVDFANTYMDEKLDIEEEGYIYSKDTDKKLFKIYNSDDSYYIHRAKLGNRSLVNISDDILKLRAATDSETYPVPDEARYGAGIATGIHYGPHQEVTHEFKPPVRIEIRFRPYWVPGNFVALWMMTNEWVKAPDDTLLMQEYDLIEAGGQFDEGDGPAGKHDVRSAVHSWQSKSSNGGHKSLSVHTANAVDFGSKDNWNTAVFEWLTGPDDEDKTIRYYINDHLLFEASPKDFDNPSLLKDNKPVSENYSWAESIRKIWNKPMNLKLWHQIQLSHKYLAYDKVDPDDFPVSLDFKWIRSYKKK